VREDDNVAKRKNWEKTSHAEVYGLPLPRPQQRRGHSRFAARVAEGPSDEQVEKAARALNAQLEERDTLRLEGE
jgi:hypothetical protein